MYVFLVASSVGTRAGVMCEGVEVGCDGKGLVDWYEPTERENKVLAAQSQSHFNSLLIDARQSSRTKAVPTVLVAILSSLAVWYRLNHPARPAKFFFMCNSIIV